MQVKGAFLDANVLFSAAYREQSGLRRLWEIREVKMVTAGYAVEEARRNLGSEDQRARLAALLAKTELVPEAGLGVLPTKLVLAEKDVPILAAAVSAKVQFLITGDARDFGPLFGQRVCGVLILRPAEFLRHMER